MKRMIRTYAVAAGAAAALSMATSAHAAVDITGPKLTVPAASSYLVGHQMADMSGEDGFLDNGTLREYQWTATDDSDICGYSVDTLSQHDPDEVGGWSKGELRTTNATTDHFVYNTSNYYKAGHLEAVRINAYDCAGNVTSVVRSSLGINLEQDYGPTIPSGWKRTTWVGAIGDSMLNTSTYKTSLSTVVTGDGKHVALVMAKGPARGKASLYFDGSYVKTIDTYAATNINRVVMWDKELNGTSSHTIKIVNQATSGRPRIDIDAYVS